jgi:hypothetical protein
MKKALIFSGYNVRAVIALCRLIKSGGQRACIIARDKSDPIFKTEYSQWVYYTRNTPKLDIALFCEIRRCLIELVTSGLVLMPTSEYLNRFALGNQSALADLEISIPLVSYKLYTKLSNKFSFRALCERHDIDVPAAVPFLIESIPFVAKQKSFEQGGLKQAKPYLITNPNIFATFEQGEVADLYFFEQYLCGKSVYLMLFISETETFAFSQQNLLQQAKGGSMIAAMHSDFHNCEVAEHIVQLLKQEGFVGPIMIEFRINDERAYMIEANPRFWGPLQFCVDNCPQLVWAFLCFCGIMPTTIPQAQARKADFYLWTGGWQKNRSDSHQVQHHPGSEILFEQSLPQLLKDDVFYRNDTMSLFLAEINMECFT